ncbi:MAG: 7-cyano-7-deazaguanine synthase [Candidatus Cloacimonas sp.]|jgi:7-cyano-7-deazaguanine synthase|nr:7-cyano-7-deazaguanine synthase [Candidatus Cloacimonas sp.]
MSRAIVLLSGGMDSLVCAATAVKECEEVYFLHFSYGQRTESKELACFEALVSHYQPKGARVVDYHWLKEIGGSALTDESININSRAYLPAFNSSNPLTHPYANTPALQHANTPTHQHANTPALQHPNTPALQHANTPTLQHANTLVPSTYVPFRNATLLCAAVAWAEVILADRVYIGAVEEDSSGYPDCRETFFEAFEKVILTGTKTDREIKVITPVLHLNKAEIVQLGMQLQAPFHHSWSCYVDNEQACGVCDSCVLRLKAFAKAGFIDPILYRKDKKWKSGKVER